MHSAILVGTLTSDNQGQEAHTPIIDPAVEIHDGPENKLLILPQLLHRISYLAEQPLHHLEMGAYELT